jgi:hypothetical protein
MADTEPTPNPEAPAAATAPPLQRLWRDLPRFEDHRTFVRETRRAVRRGRIIFAIVGGMLALAGAFIGLLSWMHPVAPGYFVPLWITEYESRLIPVDDGGDSDREAFRVGSYFPRVDENAFGSQLRHLLVRDLAALKERRTGSVVVYFSAFACRGDNNEVMIFPADAQPNYPTTRVPLKVILNAVYDCPAKNKLLILDIMRPVASARLGILENDAATLVRQEVENELKTRPDPRRLGLILCGCSEWQESLGSEDLDRSVFSFYLEEGLRGWAAGYNSRGLRNNRVTARELANFVQARVDRWALRNRNTRQTPILLGVADDFALVALDHGAPLPHLETPEMQAYPKWLREGWVLRDQWKTRLDVHADPRLLQELEGTLLRAEQEWRAGISAGRISNDLKIRSEELKARLEKVRTVIPLPEPRSIALAVTLGAKTDPAVAQDLRTLLVQIQQSEQEAKPEEAAKARAKLVQAFQDKYKAKTYFEMAWAVVTIAEEDTDLTADKTILLDSLLRQRQLVPSYVETFFLHRLAELAAETGKTAWPRTTAQLALEIVRKGEQATIRPRTFPWVRSELQRAAQQRYNGEYLLIARGYAPLEQAEQALRDARNRYDLVLSYQDTIRSAQNGHDEAFSFLTFYPGYLEQIPGTEPQYDQAIRAAIELNEVLVPPSSGDGAPALSSPQLAERVKVVAQKAESLRNRMDDLRWSFGADRVASLISQSKLPDATPAIANAIDAILATPFLNAQDRIALWTADRELCRRLLDGTRELDTREDELGQVTPRPADYDLEKERYQHWQEKLAMVRADSSFALLELGGMFPDKDLPRMIAGRRIRQYFLLQNALGIKSDQQDIEMAKAIAPLALRTPAQVDESKARAADTLGPFYLRIGNLLRRSWAELVPERLQRETDVFRQDRLARVVAPVEPMALIDDPRTNPAVRLRSRETRELWTWTYDFYRYLGRDLDQPLFYAELSIEYQRAAGNAPETVVQMVGCAPVPYLTRFNPVYNCDLHVRLYTTETAKPTLGLSVVTADDDWLNVRLSDVELSKLRDTATDMRACTLPLRIELKPGAELSRTPRPRGFLILLTVDGRVFHHRITIPALPLPIGERVEAILSADPTGPSVPVENLRLRPLPARQPYYLFVRNSTKQPRTVQVLLKVRGTVIAGGDSKIPVAPQTFKQVDFNKQVAPGAPPAVANAVAAVQDAEAALKAARPTPLPEFLGPLHILVVDAERPTDILDEKLIEVGIAAPREYVQVTEAKFSPPTAASANKNRLDVKLRPIASPAGPPIRAQLVLPPDRIPGFISAKDGNFIGNVPSDGSPLVLYAENIRLEEGAPQDGYFYVTVDGQARAFIFRTTFARQGSPATPREDRTPALRLRAPRFTRSNAKYEVQVEVDNPPPNAFLELMVERTDGSTDLVQKVPHARDFHLGFSPQGPNGSLQFEAMIRDVNVALNTSGIQGARSLTAMMLGRDGKKIREVTVPVTFDDSPPDQVRFLNPPVDALRTALLTLQARGRDNESGIAKVIFFVGKPVDGKIPPTVPQAQAVVDSTGTWTGKLQLAGDRRGPTDISVQFINNVDLSTFETTTVELHDGDKKPGPGKIVGTVLEAARPQPGLEVTLTNTQAKTPDEKKPITTTTKADGTYAFDNVAPGTYTVASTKVQSGRAGSTTVTVGPGQTVTAAVELIVK